MHYQLLTTIAIVYLVVEAKAAEVTVLKYDGLEGFHFHSKDHLKRFYTFQFCLCPRNVELQLQTSKHSECECSSVIRGKSILESYPHAVYPSACIHDSDAGDCPKATFLQATGRLFVKVGIEEDTVSMPEWQELPMSKENNTYPIQLATGRSIKFSYSSAFKTDSKPSNDSSSYPKSDENRKTLSEILTLTKRSTVSLQELIHNRVAKHIRSFKPYKPGKHSSANGKLKTVALIHSHLAKGNRKNLVNPLNFDVKQFKNELTIYHNTYRAKHGAPALSYDVHLEQAAQKWANVLKSKKKCLVHEQPRKYGENLFFYYSTDFPSPSTMARMVTESFYLEGQGYDYNRFKPTALYKVGHFTQLIWNSSRRMGVGVAITRTDGPSGGPCSVPMKGYMIHVVIKYDPPGNVLSLSHFIGNVRPPKH